MMYSSGAVDSIRTRDAARRTYMSTLQETTTGDCNEKGP
jgi:hypothetical protein